MKVYFKDNRAVLLQRSAIMAKLQLEIFRRKELHAGPDTTGTFTFGQRLGLTFVSQMAVISAISVGALLGLILVNSTDSLTEDHTQHTTDELLQEVEATPLLSTDVVILYITPYSRFNPSNR